MVVVSHSRHCRSWRPQGAPTWQKITSRWMKSACFSLLVFREQWKRWIVYRGLIHCGQWGHVPTANCWPPPPPPPANILTPHTPPWPAPSLHSLPHASPHGLSWLHICVWSVLILTLHCCPALRRPLRDTNTVVKPSQGHAICWTLWQRMAQDESLQLQIMPRSILEYICISFIVQHYKKARHFAFSGLDFKKYVYAPRLRYHKLACLLCLLRITTVSWLKGKAWSTLIGHLWFKSHLCFTRKHSERKGTGYYFSWPLGVLKAVVKTRAFRRMLRGKTLTLYFHKVNSPWWKEIWELINKHMPSRKKSPFKQTKLNESDPEDVVVK